MHAKGFTLLELMMVVALIGILSAVALSGYNDYLRNANTAVVHDHYEQAIRAVRWEYTSLHASASIGLVPVVPATAGGWIDIINANNGKAPGGGEAYTAGTGSAAVGAIGVAVSGAWSSGDSAVTLSRPAYKGLTARTETISM